MTSFRKCVNSPKCTPRKLSYLLLCISTSVLLYLYLLNNILILFAYIPSTVNKILILLSYIPTTLSSYLYTDIEFKEGMKYILLWNKEFIGLRDFPSLKCPINNCTFITEWRASNIDPTRFDAIIFDEHDLYSKKKPAKRLEKQIYIFASCESSHIYPACELYNDNFYNWTYTYRLDSDIVWSYFVVRNHSGDIVAPASVVNWQENADPISPEIKLILGRKRKAAAWLVSHCRGGNQRDEYLKRLQEHLYIFSLQIDIFGSCSKRKCPKDDCTQILRNDYYFYMAFENSFTEDYVTEKVLHGYNNYVVPIVYGDANYTKFLPPGSYINARHLHPYTLASQMYRAITNPDIYENYFKWRKLYKVTTYSKTDHSLCELCADLHGEKPEHAPAIRKFRIWWNGLNGMKWCLSASFWNDTIKLNIDFTNFLSLY